MSGCLQTATSNWFASRCARARVEHSEKRGVENRKEGSVLVGCLDAAAVYSIIPAIIVVVIVWGKRSVERSLLRCIEMQYHRASSIYETRFLRRQLVVNMHAA
ncbi:hypothetical protein BD410DRAFT_788387 [Rickenella mellea]|uniref:Uncharacterized protein n=1 Tax=Rickenella mellea TaxID=50990 RepID=A0A4Y7Q5T9_9AGAM|nr:hypothetical protein BD410DRAFT_788387 [Rickenella mellea]